MRVSAEELRSLEGWYRWRSERYFGPVPVIKLKQSEAKFSVLVQCVDGLTS